MSTIVPVLVLVLALVQNAISARPGTPFLPSTTFIYSTPSFTVPRQHHHPVNNNDNDSDNNDLRSDLHRTKHRLPDTATKLQSPNNPFRRPIKPRPSVTKNFPPGLRSFRELAKDIANVIFACAAISAGTIYIVWPVLTHPHGFFRLPDEPDDDNDHDNGNDDDDDEVVANAIA